MKEKTYFFWLVGLIAVTLTIFATFNIWLDPYWLWLKPQNTRSSSYLTDNMMLVKSLQVITRQPIFLLMGSSRVYHSMDPSFLKHSRVYNMGISSLTVMEAASYLQYVVKWAPIHTVVYGLDFFAFDDQQFQSGFNHDIDKPGFVLEDTLYALLNIQSTKASISLLDNQDTDLKNHWTWSGYDITAKRTKSQIDTGLAEMQLNDYTQPHYFGDHVFEALNSIIATCQQHHIKLILFFSPLNYRQQNAIKLAGKWSQFLAWKQLVTQMAQKNKVTTWDFLTQNSVTTYPFLSATQINNNPYYLDTSHYSPLVAKFILERLGFPLNNPVPVPKNFGIQLVP